MIGTGTGTGTGIETGISPGIGTGIGAGITTGAGAGERFGTSGRTPAAVAGARWTRTGLVGFGQELRVERERLGVPLEALADATKVPVRNLRALESDHWTELPGGVFTRGIVRGYCKVLGLPEHQWMERLTASAEHAAAELDWTEFAQNVKRNRVQTSPAARRRWWGVAGMLLTLAALAWAAWQFVLHDRLPHPLDWPARARVAATHAGTTGQYAETEGALGAVCKPAHDLQAGKA